MSSQKETSKSGGAAEPSSSSQKETSKNAVANQAASSSHETSDARNPQQPAEQATGSTQQQEVVKLHAKTSTPDVPPCGCPETIFYHRYQNLGPETRHVEFKRGVIAHDQMEFIWVVAKYMCGFLNSEGGTIYFGVRDDGAVMGIRVDQRLKEDLQKDIAYAARSLIRPCVATSEYSVNFARIMESNGEFSSNMKVLEVCVKPRVPLRRGRYSCGGFAFIKRDGSLQRGDTDMPDRIFRDPPPRRRY